MAETQFRKDPHTGRDYINYGGERVPETNRGYRVEMRGHDSHVDRADLVFVLPAESVEDAVKQARKNYPGYVILSVRLENY
jgi:hypothetical protein